MKLSDVEKKRERHRLWNRVSKGLHLTWGSRGWSRNLQMQICNVASTLRATWCLFVPFVLRPLTLRTVRSRKNSRNWWTPSAYRSSPVSKIDARIEFVLCKSWCFGVSDHVIRKQVDGYIIYLDGWDNSQSLISYWVSMGTFSSQDRHFYIFCLSKRRHSNTATDEVVPFAAWQNGEDSQVTASFTRRLSKPSFDKPSLPCTTSATPSHGSAFTVSCEFMYLHWMEARPNQKHEL